MKKSGIVRKGYDKIASRYANQRHRYPSKALLLKFMKAVPKKSKVLDLGCGAGIPIAKTLAFSGYNVTGIDFADGMIELARKNVNKAKFLKMDMTKMVFPSNYFDAAISFYAIIHIPRKNHSKIYKKLHGILKPNAIMLVNASGTKKWEETAKDYLGVPMFWSFYSPNKTLKIIEKEGFEVMWSEALKLGGEQQFWVLAKNKKRQ
jgi:ubiquinone/menaquinone biosynthesis C-methylase UbiE